jgi:hypothetical protein
MVGLTQLTTQLPQVYKLADDFTCSGSEDTFNQLQKLLEELAVRHHVWLACLCSHLLTPPPVLDRRSAHDGLCLLKYALVA